MSPSFQFTYSQPQRRCIDITKEVTIGPAPYNRKPEEIKEGKRIELKNEEPKDTKEIDKDKT